MIRLSCVGRNSHRGEQRCGGVGIWRPRTWRGGRNVECGGQGTHALLSPATARGRPREAQCPVIPAIEASVHTKFSSCPRLRRAEGHTKFSSCSGRRRPVPRDAENGSGGQPGQHRQTEQTAGRQPSSAMMPFLVQRPASSVQPASSTVLSARPSIQCPHRGPVGCASLFSKAQGRPGSASGCISSLLCCSKPSGHSTRGPATEPGTHQQEGAILAILLSPSPVAPLALSTCSYGSCRGRTGGLASKIKIIPANRPSFSPPPLKALVPECPFCCCLVSSHDGIPASPSPSDTHAQPASASGRIAFALLPAVTLPPVFLRLSFTWRCYP